MTCLRSHKILVVVRSRIQFPVSQSSAFCSFPQHRLIGCWSCYIHSAWAMEAHSCLRAVWVQGFSWPEHRFSLWTHPSSAFQVLCSLTFAPRCERFRVHSLGDLPPPCGPLIGQILTQVPTHLLLWVLECLLLWPFCTQHLAADPEAQVRGLRAWPESLGW